MKLELEDRPYRMALSGAPGIGPRRFKTLMEAFGNAKEAWKASPAALLALLGENQTHNLEEYRAKIEPLQEWEKLKKKEIHCLFSDEDSYPRLLKQISAPPPVLYYRGEYRPDDEVSVAVVGSRSATPGGLALAEELAGELAAQGVTVISGMARGIDSAAHRGALQVKGGRTIAVLGNGFDRIYPPENRDLMREISERGMVCSEFSPDIGPLAKNFPIRNRVISGLSLGVVVVEAAEDSGSLITATFALEQGREVFAVPGPIDRRVSKGSNRLIKQGAKLIEGARDILDTLNLAYVSATKTVGASEMSAVEKKIWELLSQGETHIDLLVRDSGLPFSQVGAALVLMELKGMVREVASHLYRRNPV